jgi:hypothetical protein
MSKEFIPYEQALELKELGFNELCLFYYADNEALRIYHQSEIYDDLVGAPLYQQAFRWFREKHNLKGGILYIGGLKPETTWWDIYVVGHYNIEYNEMEMKYQPYEEAELDCLKKLIEIVKNDTNRGNI